MSGITTPYFLWDTFAFVWQARKGWSRAVPSTTLKSWLVCFLRYCEPPANLVQIGSKSPCVRRGQWKLPTPSDASTKWRSYTVLLHIMWDTFWITCGWCGWPKSGFSKFPGALQGPHAKQQPLLQTHALDDVSPYSAFTHWLQVLESWSAERSTLYCASTILKLSFLGAVASIIAQAIINPSFAKWTFHNVKHFSTSAPAFSS